MLQVGSGSIARRLMAAFGGKAASKPQTRAALPAGTDTKISQSLEEALERIRADGAQNVLISGDRAFRDSVAAAAPALRTEWVSCVIADLKSGAGNPDQADMSRFDAVLCGGAEVGVSYRHAVARMAAVDIARPVHWVAKDWEFCGGTLPVPSEADDAEALLFNHFQHYFGIKDPLLFRIELYHGAERKYFYRIMQPNQSLLIRLSEHFPTRSEPCCIAAFVAHPVLTRGRHYRLRTCGDIFWRDSFTTLHSAHEFKRSPDHKFEFRMPQEMVRAGEVVLTLPNYARDLGEERGVAVTGGPVSGATRRDDTKFLEEVKVARNGGAETFFGWKYRGYGGSFWYNFEGPQACSDGHRGSLSANHHASVPVAERTDWSATPEEVAELVWLRDAGFMVEPFPMPVVPEEAPIQFLVDFDGSNPQFNRFRLYFFAADGTPLGETAYEKAEPGPFSPSAIARRWPDQRRDQVALAIVTPDWEAIGIRRKGFKLQPNLVVQDRRTGDRDVTEFQNCWRNCGAIVPGMAAFAGPASAVYGRTNLFARVRTGAGLRTAVFSVNGSGNRNYRREAVLDVTVFNQAGVGKTATLTLPPFGWRLSWIDELMPELAAHLGSAGVGALLVGSSNADVNCHVVTSSSKGAVSLQHMWGY